MTAQSLERHWMESFAALEAARTDEPAWLGASRKAAIARFAELGFPSRRHEEWKYTNPARIAKVPWLPADEAAPTRSQLASFGLPLAEGPHLVFANGRFAPELSSLEGLDPSVTAASFRSLLASAPERLEPHLAHLGPFEDRAFAALAGAFATDGAFVSVPRGIALTRPIYVVFVSLPGALPTAVHPRLLLVAEPSSRATLVEAHVGLGSGALLENSLAEVVVGENAGVEHVALQLEGAEATHIAHSHARIDRDGRFQSHLVSLGAALARHDVAGTLAAPGASCTLNGLYVATDGQHVDIRTTVDHRAPHGASRELYKGVLAGRSHGIFNGKVLVRREAQKTDAQQKNDNLLLSAEAEVDSKPQLEIEADDVRCSHGSTIGQLDAEALFYLRARGLDPHDARGLLTRAFAAQITDALPIAVLRERVEAEVLARVAGALQEVDAA